MSTLLCAICRESLDVGTLNKSCTLPCGHVFHDHCIYNWLERSQTCPHCRIASKPEQIIKLYFDISEDSQTWDAESLKKEVQRLKEVLDKKQTEFREKSEDCKIFHRQLNAAHKSNEVLRKKTSVLNYKIDKLKVVKSEFERQKNSLKMSLRALEKEKARCAQFAKDIQKYQKIKRLLDGSVEDASTVINSEECVDFDTLKVCFTTMKRDFKNLALSEAKLKSDYSNLFSLYKALERTNNTLLEKCSIQERIIETYKADLNSSPNSTLTEVRPSESKMDVDETHFEPNLAKNLMPRRSPRNLTKRSVFNVGTTISTNRQLSYDGLGGHSAEDDFPSARLKPCRIVSNRRK